MKNTKSGKRSLCVVVATLAILSASSAAWAEKPAEAASPAKPVVVTNTDPIPVEGDINATIQGTVPVLVENQDPIPVMGDVNAVVSGIVEVENFNNQMDNLRWSIQDVESATKDLEFEIQEVREAVDRLQPAQRESWTWVDFNHMGSQTDWCVSSTTWTDTDLIVISAEDDSVRLILFDEDDCSGSLLFAMGARHRDFPTVQPIQFPSPISFRSFQISCLNSITDCEVYVSMVGSKTTT